METIVLLRRELKATDQYVIINFWMDSAYNFRLKRYYSLNATIWTYGMCTKFFFLVLLQSNCCLQIFSTKKTNHFLIIKVCFSVVFFQFQHRE